MQKTITLLFISMHSHTFRSRTMSFDTIRNLNIIIFLLKDNKKIIIKRIDSQIILIFSPWYYHLNLLICNLRTT